MRSSLALAAGLALLLAGSAFAPAPSTPTPSQQLFMLKQVHPSIAKIAIIWDSDSGDDGTLERVRRAAASHGVEVLLARVESTRDVAPAFRELARTHDADALWIVSDDGLLAREPSKSFVLREATLARLTVLAPDANWVRAGATLAVLEGPDGVRLAVNKPSADALSLQIPETYVAVTDFLAAR